MDVVFLGHCVFSSGFDVLLAGQRQEGEGLEVLDCDVTNLGCSFLGRCRGGLAISRGRRGGVEDFLMVKRSGVLVVYSGGRYQIFTGVFEFSMKNCVE